MLHEAGITELRYPVPWHRIEAQPGHFDWSWMDGPAHLLRNLGMRPIFDPLHHVSFPDWLEDGFAHQDFPELYLAFVRRVAERYPWVDRYTVFNEPLPTVLLCSRMGVWYPNRRSDDDFVHMVRNSGRAICDVSAMLRELNPDVTLIHVDSCEHHRALDQVSQPMAEFCNTRRFLFHDLVCGRIDAAHPLCSYLQAHGFSEADLFWFREHRQPFDVLGLDYYPHQEIDWAWSDEEQAAVIRFPCSHGLGFAEIGGQYARRYNVPILLAETNVGGTITDRVVWLKIMEKEAQRLAEQTDFQGFCWFPSIDATDWNSLVTVAGFVLSPMGLWGLDQDRQTRHPSELSDAYVRLNSGAATWSDLRTYPLQPPLDRDLHGFLHLLDKP